MPGMDGKGPQGTGPLGQGQGNCRKVNIENTTDQTRQPNGPEQDAARGPGMGRGRGNRGQGGAGRGGRCGPR